MKGLWSTIVAIRIIGDKVTLELGSTFIFLYGNGAPEEIRTPDPQIRSLVLYPAELRALTLPRAPPAQGRIAIV